MNYVELSSAKYLASVEDQDSKLEVQERNRKAIRDFTTFLLGLFAMQVGVIVVQNLPVWRPYLEHVFATFGLA